MTHHAVAEVYLLTPQEGGRSRMLPFTPSYRPQFYYGDHNWDARYEWLDDQAFSGDSGLMAITFLSPENHIHLRPGMTFELREGSRTIGQGKIL